MLNLLVSFVTFVMLSLSSSVRSESFEVATYYAPPFSMFEDKEQIGLAYEATKQILNLAKIKEVEYRQYPLARAKASLNKGKISAFFPFMSMDGEEDEMYELVGPISKDVIAIFATDTNLTIETLDNYKTKSLGAERNSVEAMIIEDAGYKTTELAKVDQCFKMLNVGRIDACVAGILPGKYIVSFNSLTNISSLRVGLESQVYLAISKKVDDKSREEIKKAFKSLQAQGWFDQNQAIFEERYEEFLKYLKG